MTILKIIELIGAVLISAIASYVAMSFVAWELTWIVRSSETPGVGRFLMLCMIIMCLTVYYGHFRGEG